MDSHSLLQTAVDAAADNIKAGGLPSACVIASSTTRAVVAVAADQVAQTGDITAHAELLAIREASAKVRSGASGRRPLAGCTAYLVAAPCAMCSAALEASGIDAVVYAAPAMPACAETATTTAAAPVRTQAESYATAASALFARWAEHQTASSPAASPSTASSSSAASQPHGGAGALPAKAAAPACGYKVGQTLGGTELVMEVPAAGSIDARRPETMSGAQPVPAWGEAADLAPLLTARNDPEEWGHLLSILGTRGDALQAFYASLRDVNADARAGYARMLHSVGRNIFPLIIATDYEPETPGQSHGIGRPAGTRIGYGTGSGIGSTFTLYLEDGSVRRIAPCPPQYEMYKALSHMPLGLGTIISPFFASPRSGGWQGQLAAFRGTVATALAEAAAAPIPADMRDHAVAMLSATTAFIDATLSANVADAEAYTAYCRSMLPLVQVSMANAARLQVEAALPPLRKWREELGPKLWRNLYVVVPTVWTVSGRNARQAIFEQLMDADRIRTHLIKAEGASTIDDARTTLGRVVGDRVIGHMVFGTHTPDARNLMCALSTPRDIIASACDDAIETYNKRQGIPLTSPVAGAAGGHPRDLPHGHVSVRSAAAESGCPFAAMASATAAAATVN